MYTLYFKEGLTSFFLFIRFAIIRIVYARIFFDIIIVQVGHICQ